MAPITEEEIILTLKFLPNNKAAGLSEIQYKIFKKLPTSMIKCLSIIFTQILHYGITPTTWRTSNLILLPKPKNWEGR